MKKTKHIFTFIGLILLAATAILIMASCDTPEEVYVATFVHDGEVVYEFTYTDTIELPKTPHDADYGFRGWETGRDKYEEGMTLYGYRCDVTFTSVWSEYTIHLICNNDLGTERNLPTGSTYTTPRYAGWKQSVFPGEYCKFVGWRVTELISGNTGFVTYTVKPGETITVNGDIELAAIWILNHQTE